MNNEKGYALLVSILAIVFISVIGISLFSITTVSQTQSTNERKDQSIFYIAEAGLNIKEARIEKLIEQAYNASKANEENFEATFNSNLQSILSSESYSIYDHSIFESNYNGNPKAIVTVEQDPSNIRAFKIVSIGSIDGTSKERKVEKLYTIPTILINKITIQKPVEGALIPTDSSAPIAPPTLNDFTIQGEATNYFSKRLEIHGTPGKNFNMYSYTKFPKKDSLLTGNLFHKYTDYINFNSGYKNLTPKTISHINAPVYTENTSGSLKLSPELQVLSSNLLMPYIPNGSTNIFNIHTDSNVSIVFPNERTSYNLSNFRFNVTGNGTLNLVFQKSFQQDAKRKFVIDTRSTAAKVNVIFKNYAHLFGDFQAQNIFLTGSGDLDVHSGGKLIANDVFMNSGNFIKQVNASVHLINLSIKNGSLKMYAGNGIKAKHIQLLNGGTEMSGATNLVTESFTIQNGSLQVPIYSCLKSKEIYVKDGRLDVGGKMHYNTLANNYFSASISATINTGSSCENVTTTIIPPPDIPTQQFIDVDEYVYLNDSNYLEKHPLIEIN